jgi:hypothetical protein
MKYHLGFVHVEFRHDFGVTCQAARSHPPATSRCIPIKDFCESSTTPSGYDNDGGELSGFAFLPAWCLKFLTVNISRGDLGNPRSRTSAQCGSVDARLGQRPLVRGSVAPSSYPAGGEWRGSRAAYQTTCTDYTRTDQAKHGEAVRAQL